MFLQTKVVQKEEEAGEYLRCYHGGKEVCSVVHCTFSVVTLHVSVSSPHPRFLGAAIMSVAAYTAAEQAQRGLSSETHYPPLNSHHQEIRCAQHQEISHASDCDQHSPYEVHSRHPFTPGDFNVALV